MVSGTDGAAQRAARQARIAGAQNATRTLAIAAAAGLIACAQVASGQTAKSPEGAGGRTAQTTDAGLVIRPGWVLVGAEWSMGYAFRRGAQAEALPEAGGGLLPNASGPRLTYGLRMRVGRHGVLDWEGAVSHLSASRTTERLAPFSGSFAIQSGTPPAGTVQIDTAPSTSPAGAAASATVTAPGANGTTVTTVSNSFSPATPPGNQVSVLAYSPTPQGGTLLSMGLDGQSLTAAGFAAIFSGRGATVIGVGGPGWTRITTSTRDATTSRAQTLRLGRRMEDIGGWTLTPRLGLGVMTTDRSISQSNTYSITLPQGGSRPGGTIAGITLGTTERLKSDYVSVTIGAGARRAIGRGWTLSMSLDGGRGRMSGQMTTRYDAYIPGATSQSTLSTPRRYAAMTWVGRATLGLRRAIGPKTTVSIGVYGDYLSAVPTMVTRPGPGSGGTVSSGPSSTSYTGAGAQPGYTRAVVTRPGYSAGLTLGIVHRF